MLPYEVKDLSLEGVETKAEGSVIRELTGYVAAFGNVDSQLDVIEPGAFQRTIAERINAGKVKLLADHLWDTEHTLGTIVEGREDDKGLWIRADVDSDEYVQRLVGKVARKHVTGMSIGYESMAASFEEREDQVIRHLEEVKLFEGSVTPFPANEEAEVLGVKSRGEHVQKHVAMLLGAALKYGRRNSSADEDRLRAIMREVEELLGSDVELVGDDEKRTAGAGSDGSPAPLSAPKRLVIARAKLAQQRALELTR